MSHSAVAHILDLDCGIVQAAIASNVRHICLYARTTADFDIQLPGLRDFKGAAHIN